MNKHNIQIIDNFLPDAMCIRKEALENDFHGNTNSRFSCKKLRASETFKHQLAQQVCLHIGKDYLKKVIDSEFCLYNKQDEFTNKNNGFWIHSDRCRYIGIVFLSQPKNAHDGGLSFYRHKATGVYNWWQIQNDRALQKVVAADSAKPELWEELFYTEFIFNRLIIFDSHFFHQARNYFGGNKETSRLTLNIFFN